MVQLKIAFLLLVGFLLQQSCFAAPDGVEEHRKVHQLTAIAALYAKEHGGSFPTSFEQLKDYVDLRELLSSNNGSLGSVADRYTFLDTEIKIPGKGRAVLIGTKPIFNPEGSTGSQGGRYVGYVGSQGNTGAFWILEADILNLLDETKVELKPIGGEIPAPTWVNKPREVEITDYQKRVMEAVKKGEVPIQPRNDQETSKPSVVSKAEPSVTAQTTKVESGSNWLLILGSVAVALVVGFAAFRVWKK